MSRSRGRRSTRAGGEGVEHRGYERRHVLGTACTHARASDTRLRRPRRRSPRAAATARVPYPRLVRVSVLGATEAWRGEQRLLLGSRKRRALVAALALSGGR